MTVSSLLNDARDWSYGHQTFKLEYIALDQQTGKQTPAVRYGITSTAPELDAPGLLAAVRRHWAIKTGVYRRWNGSLHEKAMWT